ncbi:unnamed protein product, partial [Mesorhabditis spiculigera]
MSLWLRVTRSCRLYSPQASSSLHCLTSAATRNFSILNRNSPRIAIRMMHQVNAAGDHVDVVAKRIENIITSPEDKRQYRGLILKNDLRVLLVSDSETDKSAAALDVNVGHLMDPWELPGVAHFCEHMLFLGSEKYPVENDYGKFISQNGGMTNAYTSTDRTNYHFNIKPDALPGALDRFVQFFLCPLFTADATEKEVNAVDSEHSNNLNKDVWRAMQIDRNMSKPGHDHGKFGTGNKKTLLEDAREKGIEPREALLRFHKQHYSSSIMSLAILGNEPLDKLESYVAEMGFAEIENKQTARPHWPEHPYGPEEQGKIVYMVPVKDSRSLELKFAFPDLRPEHQSQADHLISHLLGHEGPGSLLSELKRRGWVSSLSAGSNTIANGFGRFSVAVDLSPEGIENIDAIMVLMFQAIGLIKRTGPKEWVHKELAEVGANQFRFQDKTGSMTTVTKWAGELQYTEFPHILSANYLMTEWRPERITELLELLRPENMICRVTGLKYAGHPNNVNEPVYGTEMRIEDMTKDQLDRLNRALLEKNSALRMPEPNPYIATDFSLKERDPKNEPGPRLIRDDHWMRVWYKQDDEFLFPKRVTKLRVSSPAISSDPQGYIAAVMFTSCFIDGMAEELYYATVAGLRNDVAPTMSGLDFIVSGLNEKQNRLIRDLLKKFINFKPDPLRYSVLKENIERQLQNYWKGQPSSIAAHFHYLLLTERAWSKQQVLACLQELTMGDMDEFIASALRRFHVEVFVHGNVVEEEAQQLARDVLAELRTVPSRPVFANEIDLRREYKLPAQSEHCYRHYQDVHPASCVDFVLQVGVEESRENVVFELLIQMLHEHAFNELRTNQQLGYLCHTMPKRYNGVQSLEFSVQGPKEPDFVEERIEDYLEVARKMIVDMPDTEFKDHVDALANKRLEKPKNLKQRYNKLWSEIAHREFHFNRAEDEVALLREVTKDELLAFFDKKIRRDGAERRKFVVMVHSNADTKETFEAKRPEQPKREISCGDRLRAELPMWALPAPKLALPPPGASLFTETLGKTPAESAAAAAAQSKL